ncbi:signal peptidase I [Actinophytocola xanthii]|uniref:signal peptidase I n=1 Tax=Actinophytocola xanthii TaxID=1912961 RepID=UPI000AC069F0|nr:signal peptidase I [Actinophytocola xanthii]
MVTPVHSHTPEDDPDPDRKAPEAGSGSGSEGETSGEAISREAGDGSGDGSVDDAGDGSEDGSVAETESTRRGRHRRPAKKQPLWRELLTLFAVAMLLTFLIQHFLGRVYSIPSGSMEQTLHGCTGCTGDRVLVDKLVYRFRDPQPGDVVVFKGPEAWTENDIQVPRSDNILVRGLSQVGALVGLAPPDERDFVKRVIAVGGQVVQCCDEQGRVMVDGRPLDEPYVYWQNGMANGRQRFDRVLVPEGTIWVMGDNRNDSCDSTCQGGGGTRGAVPVDNVIGKARYIVLPPSRWQGVGDHNPQGERATAIGAPSWQQGLPAALGLLVAWPALRLGRRLRWVLTPARRNDPPES